VHMTQQKTGKLLAIPVTTELAEAINAAAPADHLVFLVNEFGKAFTPERFTKWFVAQCERIGLKGLSPHGCARRHVGGWRKPNAPCTRSPASAGTRRWRRYSAIRRQRTRRAWRSARWRGSS